MCSKKFIRKEPDERKALLIKSAIRSLSVEGYAGLSVRKIAKEANVSQGLVNHHFGSIYALTTSAYEDLSTGFLQSTFDLVEATEGTAFDKLDAFFCHTFSEKVSGQALLKPWLVFWSLVKDFPEMEAAYATINGRVEQVLSQLLLQISKDENLNNASVKLATQGLMALLDGLWLRQCLAPEELSLADALQVSRQWAKAYRAGLF